MKHRLGCVLTLASGWQNWRTVTRSGIYLPAGAHGVRVMAVTDGFNLNRISFSASTGLMHAVPGVIQAEDFQDGGYWKSTPGNKGSQYRATGVDIEARATREGASTLAGLRRESGSSTPFVSRPPVTISWPPGSPRSKTGKSLRILVNGTDLSGTLTVPNTGGWQNWQTMMRSGIYLPAGTHAVRVVADTGAFNLNWLSLTR